MNSFEVWTKSVCKLPQHDSAVPTHWEVVPVDLPLDRVVTAVLSVAASLQWAEQHRAPDSWTRWEAYLRWAFQDSFDGQLWTTVATGTTQATYGVPVETPALRGVSVERVSKPLQPRGRFLLLVQSHLVTLDNEGALLKTGYLQPKEPLHAQDVVLHAGVRTI